MEKISSKILEGLKGRPYVGKVGSCLLYNEGFRSVKDLVEADPEELGRILEIEKSKAEEIIGAVQK